MLGGDLDAVLAVSLDNFPRCFPRRPVVLRIAYMDDLACQRSDSGTSRGPTAKSHSQRVWFRICIAGLDFVTLELMDRGARLLLSIL